MSYKLTIHNTIEIHQYTKAEFQTIMEKAAAGATSLERFPALPKDHKCVTCPIDQHTMRYVLATLMDMRNAHLKAFMDLDVEDHVNSLCRLVSVNTLDLAIGTLSGAYAPELGENLKGNFDDAK